ncbi:MAG: peptidoglycan DD-metalloendopeptidase family protein [Desulfuromonadales bacterium]|jgi:lipoprotein NlpD|nr:peptidoglycan DD-metalloendopeptidase family protein [Desulfuromonadales bacterium]
MTLFRTWRLVRKKLCYGALFGLILLTACSAAGVYHRVQAGQTLYRISKAYGIDEIYLARVNGIADPTQLRVGQNLYIPGAASVRSLDEAPPPAPSPTPVTSPPVTVTAKQPEPSRSPPPVQQPTVASGKVKLIWPLRGEILRTFAEAKKGGAKGLEIAASENSSVKAAAAGKVIYSGDGVKGYGHLIILQHENDLYTVYGFNNRNLAGQGKYVSQGEKIALSGAPPGGGEPRLHFEVRRKKTAVDPILFLP